MWAVFGRMNYSAKMLGRNILYLVLLLFVVAPAVLLYFVLQLFPAVIPHYTNEGLGRIVDLAQGCDRSESYFAHVNRETENPRLIVFVHGLFGDSRCTWGEKATARSGFISELMKDSRISRDFDIYSFGYPSGYFDAYALTPPQAGEQLSEFLTSKGGKYQEIIFVTHSMGALVALHSMKISPDVGRRASMLLALSPPFDGSTHAPRAAKILPNPALKYLYPLHSEIRHNSFLAELPKKVEAMKDESSEAYRFRLKTNAENLISLRQDRVLPPFSIRCGFESRPASSGERVVEKNEASSAICDSVASINRDHLGVVGLGADFVATNIRSRIGPNPGVSVEISRVVDYTRAQCGAIGIRKDIEHLIDTYRFSSPLDEVDDLKATTKSGLEVQLFDLNDGGRQIHPKTIEECSDRSKCKARKFFSGLKSTAGLSGTEFSYRWQWMGESAANLGGVEISSSYPVTSLVIKVMLPSDAEYQPNGKLESSRLSCTSAYSGRIGGHIIDFNCTPKEGARPLYGPIGVNFESFIDFPVCQRSS